MGFLFQKRKTCNFYEILRIWKIRYKNKQSEKQNLNSEQLQWHSWLGKFCDKHLKTKLFLDNDYVLS